MGEQVNIYDISALQHAALNPDGNFLQLVKRSKQAANQPGAYNNTPLFAAVTRNNLKVLQWYLANVEQPLQRQNTLGYTPLYWAIDAGVRNNATVINAMLAAMSDFSHRDKFGNNVMHLLVECLTYQNPESVIALMRRIHAIAPSLLQQQNCVFMTPFELAEKYGLQRNQLQRLLEDQSPN